MNRWNTRAGLMSSRFLVLIAVAMLSSCTVKLRLNYVPDPVELTGLSSKTFSIKVMDVRPLVTHAEKAPWYLGTFRGGYGNPWDVANFGKVALADQMRDDFRKELQALGLVESSSAAKQVLVRIRDWNFDAYINGRFWYDIELSVTNFEGEQFATSRVMDEKKIKGEFWGGPKNAFQEELPIYYGDLIVKLVRGDPSILSALSL